VLLALSAWSLTKQLVNDKRHAHSSGFKGQDSSQFDPGKASPPPTRFDDK
jgi:hypothetical protein